MQQTIAPSTGNAPSLPPFAFEREPGAAAAPLPAKYKRHEPEKTALYTVVAGNLETFLEAARQQSTSGTGCPAFIEREIRNYAEHTIMRSVPVQVVGAAVTVVCSG